MTGVDVEGRHLVLVGLMGVGKTTLGSELAGALGRPFHDSDAVIVASRGEPGTAIAARDGVAALHEVELAVFTEMVSTATPAVIAPAASVLDHPEGRTRLRSHIVIWLVADDDVLEQRRHTGGHRRPIEATEAAALRLRRDPWFAEVSALRLDTGAHTVADLIDQILRYLQIDGGDQPSI